MRLLARCHGSDYSTLDGLAARSANNQTDKGRVACVVALYIEEAPQMWQGCV